MWINIAKSLIVGCSGNEARQASSKTKMGNSFLVTDRRIRTKVTSPKNVWLPRKPFGSYIPVFSFVFILFICII